MTSKLSDSFFFFQALGRLKRESAKPFVILGNDIRKLNERVISRKPATKKEEGLSDEKPEPLDNPVSLENQPGLLSFFFYFILFYFDLHLYFRVLPSFLPSFLPFLSFSVLN